MKTKDGKPTLFAARYARAADGTRLRYFDSEGDGPVIVLANGLGGPSSVWNPYLRIWGGQYRLLSWDYRGLYGSTLGHDGAKLDISTHAEDLAAIFRHAEIPQATFLGWSMGVQVGIEFNSRYPALTSALILTSGTYGRPLRGVPLPFSGVVLPPLVRGVRQFHGVGRWLLGHVSRSRLSYSVLRRLYLIAPSFERELFEQMVQEFESVDLEIYLALLENLQDHDARHLLPQIDVPTLVITGARDFLTPPWFAREMAQSIPQAKLFVVPGGTHYSAAEYPQAIAARIEHFLHHEAKKTRRREAPEFANPPLGS